MPKPILALYAAALGLGVAAMLLVLPPEILWGAGAGWHPPGPDQAQALTGHLAFQADRWRWPLLDTGTLFWPHGISLALVDSNALVSLLAKAWVSVRHTGPENWLGAFIGACWLLQPVAAVYAARGLKAGPAGCLAAAVLSVAWPALMFRMMHLNLCAHFLILVALGLAFRGLAARPGRAWWGGALAVLLVSILTHPYLFQLCAAVLAAVPMQAAIRRQPGWKTDAGLYLGAGVLAVLLLMGISGPIGGGDKGFTFFSMNLVSPFWPQRSGLFGDLPIVDATGGQYEGFNFLGTGTILLLIASAGAYAARRTMPRPSLTLCLILAGLTMVALSSVVYAGPYRLLNLGTKPWEDIFGSFRTAGRAFWPVGYAIMLGSVAVVDRMPRRFALPLLATAALLQLADIRPLWRDARTAWSNGSGIVVPAVPPGTTLFTAAPHPGCAKEMTTKWGAPIMLLDAVRGGARTGDIGLGRSPNWFSCERVLSDALELPLLQHEVRAFFGPTVEHVRPSLLGGPCRRTGGVHANGQSGPVMLCGEGAEGEPVTAELLPPPVRLPLVTDAASLLSLLGSGWRVQADGAAWSEGPRSTLLIPAAPGPAARPAPACRRHRHQARRGAPRGRDGRAPRCRRLLPPGRRGHRGDRCDPALRHRLRHGPRRLRRPPPHRPGPAQPCSTRLPRRHQAARPHPHRRNHAVTGRNITLRLNSSF